MKWRQLRGIHSLSRTLWLHSRRSFLWVLALVALCGAALSFAPTAANASSSACSSDTAFAWTEGQAYLCLQGTGTYDTSGIGPQTWLANNTGYRVWFHEYSNGSGWADCYSSGNLYYLSAGSRDQHPGNIQITTNSNICSTPSDTPAQCISNRELYHGPFAWFSPYAACYYPGNYTYVKGIDSNILTNGTPYRVWLHQYAKGTGYGWADCFSPYNVYYLTGTRDAKPGSIQVSSNKSAC